jgi:hypothetical protein
MVEGTDLHVKIEPGHESCGAESGGVAAADSDG